MSLNITESCPSDIEHESYLIQQLSALYSGPNLTNAYSDIVIVADGQKFYLHKVSNL